MTNNRYTTPAQGTLDWHRPLNDNFERLDDDVEVRDIDANKDSYTPTSGAKFFATDSGAVYTGDGTSWNFVGYVTTTEFAGSSHYVNYEGGLQDEEISKLLLESDEELEVTKLALPIKGTGSTDATLTVYDGNGNEVVSVGGDQQRSARSDPDAPWVASASPVTVAVTTNDSAVSAAPRVWVARRKQ
jgi:hypothetical protein